MLLDVGEGVWMAYVVGHFVVDPEVICTLLVQVRVYSEILRDSETTRS